MKIIKVEHNKQHEPKKLQQKIDPCSIGDPPTNNIKKFSQETRGLVQFLGSISAIDIRVYTDYEIKKTDPAELGPSTRRLLIREQNEKRTED